MTVDSAWILAAGLALFVAWLGWTLWRSGRARQPPPLDGQREAEAPSSREAAAAELEPRVDAPAPRTQPSMRPVPTPAPAPPPAPVAVPRREPPAEIPATASVAPAPPPVRARPAPPRIERVLAADDAGPADTTGATPLTLSAAASTALAAIASASAGRELSIRFPPGTLLAVAHGDIECMRAMASRHEDASSPVLWLDSVAAGTLAAAVLGTQARERHLDALAHEVQEIKAAVAALAPKLAGVHEAALKTLVQDLARYARDAREIYESLVAKAPFRERVDDAAARAGELWGELSSADEATRQKLRTLSSTPRFGEVQVEKTRVLLQEQRQGQRVLAIVGRAAAALAVLRLALGGAEGHRHGSPAPEVPAVRTSIEHDRDLRERLRAAEAAAQGDPYVGRGEFEASRAALRRLLDAAAPDPFAVMHERLSAAQAAVAAGFPGPREQAWDCLLRTSAAGHVGELRIRPIEPA
jgi:hypothetical protein